MITECYQIQENDVQWIRIIVGVLMMIGTSALIILKYGQHSEKRAERLIVISEWINNF